MTVDRRVKDTELAAGHLQLGEAEARSLSMPDFSAPVTVRFAGQESAAHWNAAQRLLSGETLMEELSLEIASGDRLRWTREGDVLVIEAVQGWTGAGTAVPPPRDPFDQDPFGLRRPSAPTPRAPRTSARTGTADKRVRPVRVRRAHVEADYDWVTPEVGLLTSSLQSLRASIAANGWDDPDEFALRIRGEELSTVNDFDELVAADSAAIDPMEHQYAAARKALGVMRGRAILADEVGLGKTVEAGLVVSELLVRGLAQRILVITPATLRQQWQEELEQKFGIDCAVVAKGTNRMTSGNLIMSLEMATSNRVTLHRQEWDLVILDEAHRIAGKGAKVRRELMSGFTSRYMLFLTATPVQNDLRELYRLIDLLRPGTFESERQFERRYIDGADPRRPRNPQDLRRLVSSVMIRTTRAQAGLDRVKRFPVDRPIQLGADERQAYDLVVQILRDVLNRPGDHLRRDSLARALTLSPRGLYESACRAAEHHPDPRARTVLRELAELAIDQGPTTRQRELIALVNEWINAEDKGRVIVFTQQTRVLNDLIRILDQAGIAAAAYHGGLSASAKQAALDGFRGSMKVLVSTESGAEGLNLQHANAVINYDLPWNPMRIEQRIGRVHRVTQTRDVHVANMFALGTVDEHVYSILVDKLRMFELLFGQITTILGELEDSSSAGKTFEAQIKDALFARSDGDMTRALERLAVKAEVATQRAQEQLVDSGGVSTWMSPSFDHRATISTDAIELQPEITERKRNRQKDVEAFARSWLHHHSGKILHQTPNFVAAAVHGPMRARLGTDTLYLAFSPEALAEHPGAELVAVGTPMFEDLVASTQESGDLLGWQIDVPELSDLDLFPPADCAPGMFLVKRTVAPLQAAGGRVTWRVSDEDTRVSDEVVTLGWGDPRTDLHQPVAAGASTSWMPSGSKKHTTALVAQAADGSVAGLGAVRDRWLATLGQWADEDRNRRRATLQARLDESLDIATDREVQARLHALDAEPPPRVRVRAEMLAMEVSTTTAVNVLETWSLPDGRQVAVEGTWDAGEPRVALKAADGTAIRVLAVCDDLHAVDISQLTACPQCSGTSCRCCPSDRLPAYGCPVCHRTVCRTCLPAGPSCAVCGRGVCLGCRRGDLCITCTAPVTLSPQLTEQQAEEHLPAPVARTALQVLGAAGLACRLGQDDDLVTLALSGAHRREVALVSRQGRIVRWWILTDDDPRLLTEALTAARSVALDGNLRPGQHGEETPPRPPDAVRLGLLLSRSHTSTTVWVIGEHEIRADDLHLSRKRALPSAPVNEHLRRTLTTLVPEPPQASARDARRLLRHRQRITWVDSAGLHRWTAHGDNVDTTTGFWEPPTRQVLDELTRYFPDQDRQPSMCAVLDGVHVSWSVDETHRFLHIVTPEGSTPLLRWTPVRRSSHEQAASTSPTATLWPGTEVGGNDLLAWACPDLNDRERYPSVPSSGQPATLQARTVDTPVLESLRIVLLRHPTETPDTAPDAAVPEITVLHQAPSPGAPQGTEQTPQPNALTLGTARGLLTDVASSTSRAIFSAHAMPLGQEAAVRADLLAVEAVLPRTLPIHETWSIPDGRHTTVHGHWDAADDTIRLVDHDRCSIGVLSICDELHPLDAARARRCPQCSSTACGRCSHTRQPDVVCAVCRRSVCSTCLPAGRTCPVCRRPTCEGCWAGMVCTTCAAPHEVLGPDPALAAAVETLSATGLSIRYGRDTGLTLLAVAGDARREVAILDDRGAVRDWWTLSDEDPALLAEAISAARVCGAPHGNLVPLLAEEPTPAPPGIADGVQVEHITAQMIVWTVGDRSTDAGTVALDPSTAVPRRPQDARLAEVLAPLIPSGGSGCAGLPARRHLVHHETLTWIDRTGLHRWTAAGSSVRREQQAWAPATVTAQAALLAHTQAWAHHPVPVVSAAVGTTQMLVSALGPYRLLHVITSDAVPQHTCWDVDDLLDVEALLATGLALLQEWTPVSIASTIADATAVPSVKTAVGYARPESMAWVMTPALDRRTIPPSTIREIGPTLPRLPDTLGLLPDGPNRCESAAQAVRRELDHICPTARPPEIVALSIGARYTFALGDGPHAPRGAYLVFARDLPAGATETIRGRHVETPEACDAAHVVSSVARCLYCNRRTCSDCTAPVNPCLVCGIHLCGLCSLATTCCPACSSLVAPRWLARRALLRRIPQARTALVGKDRLHDVALVVNGNDVIREIETPAGRYGDRVMMSATLAALPWPTW